MVEAVARPLPPQVSVVLPVRDGQAHLQQAIDSVLTQTLTDLELIVVDDGSGDNSPQIAADAARRDPRVVAISNAGRGVAAALNTGWQVASAKWIGRLDADDLALPHRFAFQLEHATGRDDVVAWAAWAEAIDVDGRGISAMHQGPRTASEFRREHARGRLRPIHTTMIIDRRALERVGGYDPSVERAQDIELWDRLGDHGLILTVPQVVTQVRVHAASATSRQLEATLEVHRFVAARRAQARNGNTLTLAEFRQREQRSLLRRWRVGWSVAARRRYRDGGVAYAAKARTRAIWLTATAAAMAPSMVVPRLWRQLRGRRSPQGATLEGRSPR